MNTLKDTHPILFDFFAGYFPDADLDGLTDVEVVQQFISYNSDEIVLQTKNELNNLPKDDFLLNNIAKEANRFFESTEEINEWLDLIKNQFEVKN